MEFKTLYHHSVLAFYRESPIPPVAIGGMTLETLRGFIFERTRIRFGTLSALEAVKRFPRDRETQSRYDKMETKALNARKRAKRAMIMAQNDLKAMKDNSEDMDA